MQKKPGFKFRIQATACHPQVNYVFSKSRQIWADLVRSCQIRNDYCVKLQQLLHLFEPHLKCVLDLKMHIYLESFSAMRVVFFETPFTLLFRFLTWLGFHGFKIRGHIEKSIQRRISSRFSPGSRSTNSCLLLLAPGLVPRSHNPRLLGLGSLKFRSFVRKNVVNTKRSNSCKNIIELQTLTKYFSMKWEQAEKS